LKKYSQVIYLNNPPEEEIILVINDICNKTGFIIEEKIKKKLIEYTKKDIRKLIILMESLYSTFPNTKIDDTLFNKFTKIFTEKEEDIQLFDSTSILMNQKMSIYNSQLYFDIDCLLIPLMLYHNSIDYIKNCSDDSKKKLYIYNKILNSICIHDTVQTNIFELQEWNELYDISSFYGSSLPNFYFTELKTKSYTKNIQFTNLLNKISQMFVNKKLLISAKNCFTKVNLDLDEVIYSAEILSNYFDDYRLKNDSLSDNEEDDEIEEEEYDNENNFKKIPVLKQNNSELIKYMNKYQMKIDDLENILKIEKINLINEKRKKKFTLKIKKEINLFLEYV